MLDGDVESSLAAIASDRVSGATVLALRGLDLLDAAPAAEWPALADQLGKLRPSMPLIAHVAAAAVEAGDTGPVRRRLAEDRRALVSAAIAELAGHDHVVTISHSSAVAEALEAARPHLVEVVVAGASDEGHELVSRLAAAGLDVAAVVVTDISAGIGIVGSDAWFEDGAFVNRRGTAALAEAVAPGLLLVLAEPLKRLDAPSPEAWPEPDLFELVPPLANVRFTRAQ